MVGGGDGHKQRVDGVVDGLAEGLGGLDEVVDENVARQVELQLEVTAVVLVEAHLEEHAALAAEDGPAKSVFNFRFVRDGVQVRTMIIDGLDYAEQGLVELGGLGHGGGARNGGERNEGHGVQGHSCFLQAVNSRESVGSSLQIIQEENRSNTGLYEIAKDLLKYTFRS